MFTAILWTKELGVVDNKLVELGKHRHVILVGEKLSFEINIKEFQNEPRCLSLCHRCVHRRVIVFDPKCEDLHDQRNMRSEEIRCFVGDDIWSEIECTQFTPA